jgi:HlyD family secretion protein
MDIPREGQAKKRRVRRTIAIVSVAVVVLLITIGLSKLEPAAPSVKRETLYTGEVKRGSMLRQVRGAGLLVPVDVRFVSAPVEGRVEQIANLPGVTVEADTVLLDLSNPEVERNAAEAEAQLKAAQADYENLKAQLEGQVLNQESIVSAARSEAEQAKLQADADETLAKDGLIPDLSLKISKLRAEQTTQQSRIEEERLVKTRRAVEAQLAAQQARVDQMRALYDLRRRQSESLKVRAGIAGVLQELPVQVGQRVTPGTTLARVARPDRLKAELRIPETQAKDVQIGLLAQIDTRNGIVPGRVIRVAPSVQEGSVLVDVALEGELPRGARPDLSVDGTIEIERLDNVLYVGRPSFAQTDAKVELFKLVKDGNEAIRVPVRFGRTSVNTIEIVEGLQQGDEIVISDISSYDSFDRIRID